MSVNSESNAPSGRCASRDCQSPPMNNAVPACEKHLCVRCRMGVAVAAGRDDTEMKYCAVCKGGSRKSGLF